MFGAPKSFGGVKTPRFGSSPTFGIGALTSSLALPSGPEIIGRLKKSHPRLLATAAEFAALKERVQTQAQAKQWYEALRKEAERTLTEPVSYYQIADGLRLLATSKRVQQRIYTLALLYRLDQDPRYSARAWQELEAAARFPNWNPRHFLDVAEMTNAFAIGYDWLYDAWTPQQREVLRTAILEKGLKPALACYRGLDSGGWWVNDQANWNQVCNGGIGLGALAIGDEAPVESGEVLHAILVSLPGSLQQLAPDGGSGEGPSYWDYGLSYVTLLLAGMESALGTDFGLAQTPGLDKAGFFPIYLKGPTGRSFNFSDASEPAWGIPGMFWLSRKFHQPLFAGHRLQYLEKPNPWVNALDLIWGTEQGSSKAVDAYPPAATPAVGAPESPKTPEAQADTPLPLGAYFRGTEIVTLRSAWGDPSALFVGFRAGDNQISHAHLDLGSFVFDALGERWAVDLGREDYNLPGYFGPQRTNYYRVRAEGHNTLVINPSPKEDQSPAYTRIVRSNLNPSASNPHGLDAQASFAIADLSPAYVPQATHVQRGVALIGNAQIGRQMLLVQDEIEAAQPGEVWWFMHTRAQVQVSQDGHMALLRQGNKRLQIKVLAPASATFALMDAQPLPGSPHPAGQDRNQDVHKLALHLAGVTRERIVVCLVPMPNPTAFPDKLPNVVPLADW